MDTKLRVKGVRYGPKNETIRQVIQDRIWNFTPTTHYYIVEELMESLRRFGPKERGFLAAIELALNEVSDNTFQHYSELGADPSAEGYIMAQYHKDNHRLAVVVYDTGQGISSSLSNGNHKFKM